MKLEVEYRSFIAFKCMFIHELNINEMEKPKNEEKEKCNSLFQI